MTNSNLEKDMYKVNVDEAVAQCKSNSIPSFDGTTPIDINYAKNYFDERVKFFLNRLDRATKRPTPELYDKEGNLSIDIDRFQTDLSGLLYAQKCRAALEMVMLSDKEIKVFVPQSQTPTIFKKIDDKSLTINAM